MRSILVALLSCLLPHFGRSQQQCNEGLKPKTCSDGQQRQLWYWNKTWFRCMATVSSCAAPGLFGTVEECNESCRPLDGPSCTGPKGSSPGTGLDGQCFGDESCPAGHQCVGGAFFASCCPKDQLEANEAVFSDTCPNGAKAFPNQELQAESCSDLACPSGFRCQTIGRYFAKCCEAAGPPPKPVKPQVPITFSIDGGAQASQPQAGSQKTLQIRDKATRLRAMRIMAPVRGDCFDRHPNCPGWAVQFAGTTVWWNQDGKWAQFTLPQDHCDWNPFLKTMEGCPLSCGSCKPQQIRFRFIPQTATVVWV